MGELCPITDASDMSELLTNGAPFLLRVLLLFLLSIRALLLCWMKFMCRLEVSLGYCLVGAVFLLLAPMAYPLIY